MSSIRLVRDQSIARIVLNAPERRNALDTPACQALLSAVREVAVDPSIRCLVIAATGPDFSAGADLEGMAEWLDGSPSEVSGRFEMAATTNANAFSLTLDRLTIPVISALRGHVVGGVLGLALASDFVVASTTTVLLPGHVGVGLSPDGGLSHHLQRLIGPRAATEMMMLGDPVDASTALDLGLIREVVPDPQLEEAVTGLAERLVRRPRASLAAIKELVSAAPDNTLGEQLQLEARLIGEVAARGEVREGIAAFREKRRPRFVASSATAETGRVNDARTS